MVIAMLSLSFAILSTDQDWMVFEDPKLRTEISNKMTQYGKLLDEYDNEDGYKKMEGANAFLARFGANVDVREIFRLAQFVTKELSSGGVSVVSLRRFLEVGVALDEIVSRDVPLDKISFFADTFGFSEASMWIDRITAILSKTGPAIKAFDIFFWCQVAVYVLSILLILLDTPVGPLFYTLMNVLCCAGIFAVGIYTKRQSSLGLTLATPAFVSLGLAVGAMVLWIILGKISKRRIHKEGAA
ncbi:MAG: hypothetical protein ACSW75_00200 [Lachnospiraceae bacterium]